MKTRTTITLDEDTRVKVGILAVKKRVRFSEMLEELVKLGLESWEAQEREQKQKKA